VEFGILYVCTMNVIQALRFRKRPVRASKFPFVPMALPLGSMLHRSVACCVGSPGIAVHGRHGLRWIMAADDTLKLKIQLLCGEEIAIGPGKADLLEAIAAQGSITAAARAMDMSYRRAWLLVDAMNRCWSTALVETSPGRAKGSGARLSEAGRRVLDRYRRLQEALDTTAHGDLLAGLNRELRTEPRTRATD
jgi:molybdate transport system regulatory protein